MNVQVATLSLVDGQERAMPAEMGHVFVRQGMLCILVEVSAPVEAWDDASGELVAQAIESFSLSKLNEKYALKSVIRALNHYLLAVNERLSEEKQIWAGFTAAFIRHNQLLLAQAGPALAYIARQEVVRHYPPQQEAHPAQIPTPLGYAPDIECRFARLTLQPNDIILLSASHLPRLGSEQMLNQALEYGPHEVISALITLARRDDFSALVLQYEPSANPQRPSIKPKPKPKAVAHQVAHQATSVRDELRRAAKEAIIFAPAPTNNGSARPIQQSRSSTINSGQKKNAMPKKASAKKSTVQSAKSTIKAPPQAPQERFDSQPSLRRQLIAALIAILAWLIGAFSIFMSALSDWLAPRRATAGPLLDQLTYSFWTFVHRLTHIIKGILKQVLPGDQSDSSLPRQASAPSGDGSDFIKLLTSLIPIFLLLISIGLWYLQGDPTISAENIENSENNEAAVVAVEEEPREIGSLLSEANAFIQQSENVDEAQAQELLNEANQLLTQAEALTPDTKELIEITQLREEAQTLQIQADKISRPSSIRLLSLLPENQPAILVHGTQTLFILEKNSATVYRLPTKSQPVAGLNAVQPLLAAHQTLNEAELIGVPELMTWVPGSGVLENKLLVVTEEKQIFDYNATNGFIRLLPSHPPSVAIQSAAGYASNLYILTVQEKQIWKYEADARGEYPPAPAGWLNPTGQEQIQNPIDMAIDGYIFLLDESGQVARFERGQLSKGHFALEAVSPPLSNPVAITKIPPEQSDMFVADSQRVLRFNKDGAFITEYRGQLGNDWGTIRDIAVDERLQTLYVLSSHGIYLVDIGASEEGQAEGEAGEAAE
jgi:hypothetical protein